MESEVKVLSEVRVQSEFPLLHLPTCVLPSAALAVDQWPPRGRALSLEPRQTPEDPHSLWEVPTGAKLSEDSELSLWELPWLILRTRRWDFRA